MAVGVCGMRKYQGAISGMLIVAAGNANPRDRYINWRAVGSRAPGSCLCSAVRMAVCPYSVRRRFYRNAVRRLRGGHKQPAPK